jgi:TolB-like protein
VAQVVGAMMTVALTLFVVQKAQQLPPQAPERSALVPAATPLVPTATTPPSTEMAIAVLPLADYSENPGQTSFAYGMTEALIAALAEHDDLRVISRTSSMRYRASRKLLPDIARELGATHIIEGSLIREHSRMRVTVQLIDAATDQHVWAASYDRRGGDVLSLQAELAAAIASDASGVLTTR